MFLFLFLFNSFFLFCLFPYPLFLSPSLLFLFLSPSSPLALRNSSLYSMLILDSLANPACLTRKEVLKNRP
ncbi:hypothetical protein F4801DRAFT_555517 [Xylaria longipes]|nr:hypothetical protein F4801DRAFT_555517 [Xylaria longipes]